MTLTRCTLPTLAFLLTVSVSAWAVDTVEPFALGASDFELYAGSEGLGQGLSAVTFTEDAVLGYGLTERLSATLSGSVVSDRRHRVVEQAVSAGLYGTAVDSGLLDLDLFLAWGMVDDTSPRTELVTGLELNLELSEAGLFLTAFETFGGREQEAVTGSPPDTERTFTTELGLGAFLDVAEGHQLLALFESSLEHVPEPGSSVTEGVGFALGYNVMVSDSLELINEVGVLVSSGDASSSFGLSSGFLATLP